MSNMVQFPGLGLELNVSPVAFTIGDIPVYWYGVIIAAGMLLGILVGLRKAPSFGVDPDRLMDVILVTVVVSVLCARIYYVIFYPGDYNTLAKIFNIRDGGLAIYGAVIGAFICAWLCCRWRRLSFPAVFDLAAIGFLVGQGIGRWGNFTNQEAFGTNTTLPWGMISARTRSYLAAVAGQLAQEGVTVDPALPVHPTFLYESLWCLLGFVLLLAYSKRRRFDGEITLLYVAWYGFERCIVEGLRTDSLMWGPLRVSQVFAGVSCVAALVVWHLLRKRAARRRAAGEAIMAVEREQLGKEAAGRYAAAVQRRDAAITAAVLDTFIPTPPQDGAPVERTMPDMAAEEAEPAEPAETAETAETAENSAEDKTV